MAKINLTGKYPTVTYVPEELISPREFTEVKEIKKGTFSTLVDGTSSELGEGAVDLLLEKYNAHRKWMRGQFHYDFTNADESVRLEVKTRKKYLNIIEQLDVRLDEKEYKHATESTHFVPVIYDAQETRVILPGVFNLTQYISGIEKHKEIIPKDAKLRLPSYRVPWYIVFLYPNDFGFLEWEKFIPLFKSNA